MDDEEIEQLAEGTGCAEYSAGEIRRMYAGLPLHLRLYVIEMSRRGEGG